MTDSFKNNNLSTINMFVESCYELNLSLGNDLTEKLIIDAHSKFANQHIECLQKDRLTTFDIKSKNRANEYLLISIKSKR